MPKFIEDTLTPNQAKRCQNKVDWAHKMSMLRAIHQEIMPKKRELWRLDSLYFAHLKIGGKA